MRIVTRPDFDGVACAVLLSDALGIRTPIRWVEPNQLKSGAAGIEPGDIIANLPHHPGCALWFDHHATNRAEGPVEGLFRPAPSAARNVFEYYRGRFTRDFEELVRWADRIDSAGFTREEVLHPERYDYILLSMTVSSENGSDEPYWDRLVRLLREADAARALADPEVADRCRRVVRQNGEYADWLRRFTRVEAGVAVTDFRALDRPPSGNRYLAYCLFPEAGVSVRIRYQDADKATVVVNVGHSIFNPSCKVHAGRLLARFGGGGHRGAASARFPAADADTYLPQIISALAGNRPEIE